MVDHRCFYPDWEGGVTVGYHIFDDDGFCNACGTYDPTHDQNIEHSIDNESIHGESA